jgi:hypothetical protein
VALNFCPFTADFQKTKEAPVPNLTAALAALERHCGFDRSRIRALSRQLQNDGVLPLGGPGVSPAITEEHFVALFLAAAVDPVVRNATACVQRLLAMTPGGIPLEDTPTSIPSARRALIELVEAALIGDDTPTAIEVVSNFDELSIAWPGGVVERFQPTGVMAGHWQTTTHRRACIVTGTAFSKAVRQTFGRF